MKSPGSRLLCDREATAAGDHPAIASVSGGRRTTDQDRSNPPTRALPSTISEKVLRGRDQSSSGFLAIAALLSRTAEHLLHSNPG